MRMVSVSLSRMPELDAGIDQAVGQIGQQVRDDHHQRGEEQDTEHRRRIARGDRLEREVPSPGQLNTVSTSTAPDTMPENWSPASVTTGPSALRNACL